MANNTIAQRFTENVYATKSEVKHELRTPLVDTFWKNIVAYRKQFEKPAGVADIDRTPITYCLCPSIAEKINTLDRNLNSLSDAYEMLSKEGHERSIYHREAQVDILKEIAKHNELDVDDKFLQMVIDGTISLDEEKYECLENYIRVLKNVETYAESRIDADLLATLYARLTSSNELASLFRTSEFVSSANKVVIDRIYECAPSNLINGLMSDLLDTINSDELPVVVKAALTYYYVTRILPFADHNEEMALIMTKLVLAKDDIPHLIIDLNLERLFTFLSEAVDKCKVEAQRYKDLTYFLDLFIKLMNDQIDKEISRINHISAKALKEDYYKEDYKEAQTSPLYEEEKTEESVEEIDETQYEEVTIKPFNEEIEDSVPAVEESIPEAPVEIKKEPEPEPVKVVETRIPPQNAYQGLAISSLPIVLDEKQAQLLEEDLLESDPELKRIQAYFYARHCTMGKRYTIAQFKRETGCAYETARTSMDSLAALGYYRQEMVKNKKVYTPIKRN